MILPRYYFSDEFTKFEPQLMELGQVIEFQEGEYLSAPDELMSMCYYLKNGIARFSILNDEGDENIIMFFGPGSINPCVCGEYEFTLERYIIVKAITRVTAIAFPPAVTIQMLNSYGEFGVTAIHHYCRIANLVMVNNMLSSSFDSSYRVCNFLYLYNLCNNEQITLSQENIASIVGLSRVQVSRVLHSLQDKGLIQISRKRLKIINAQELKSLCSPIVYES